LPLPYAFDEINFFFIVIDGKYAGKYALIIAADTLANALALVGEWENVFFFMISIYLGLIVIIQCF
jgi:hypothetical protein